MNIKTHDLTGPALDWAVACCLGVTVTYDRHNGWLETLDQRFAEPDDPHVFSPSTDWSQGGPIIDREKIEVTPWGINGEWRARDFYEPSPGVPCAEQYGPTPLIAVMRCYVASVLGDTVEIPEELK